MDQVFIHELRRILGLHIGSGGASHEDVTISVDGFMTASDKTKLNGIAINANNYTLETHNNAKHDPDYLVATHEGLGGAVHANVVAGAAAGFLTGDDKTKLNGIAAGADVTADNWPKSHDNTYHSTNYATEANFNSHVGSGGASHADVTTSVDGFMTASDKTKLNGISSGARPGTVTAVTGTAPVASSGGNTPAISMLSATAARNGYMTLTFAAKLNGIEALADKTDTANVTSSMTDGAHGTRGGGTLHADVVAAGDDGFMTGADKTKLNGIATGANNYTHPTSGSCPQDPKSHAHTHVSTTGRTANDHHGQSHNNTYHSTNYATEANFNSHTGSGGASHADVTTSVDGFMTASDKTKLNGIATGADVTADNWPKSHDNTYHSTNYLAVTHEGLGGAVHACATDIAHGFMTYIDKIKLDGLGTMSTQSSDSVNIDGGAIDDTALGTNAQSTVKCTTLKTTSHMYLANASKLYLDGVGGSTYIVNNSGLTRIEFWVAGTLEGYIDGTGFVSV